MADVLGAIGPARGVTPMPGSSGERLTAPFRGRTFGEVLGEVGGPDPTGARPPSPAAGPARPVALDSTAPATPGPQATAPALRQALVELVDGERRMDRVLQSALRGRDFSLPELIAVQAAVLRHAQAVEACSRLLDRLTGALKTTLQTQV